MEVKITLRQQKNHSAFDLYLFARTFTKNMIVLIKSVQWPFNSWSTWNHFADKTMALQLIWTFPLLLFLPLSSDSIHCRVDNPHTAFPCPGWIESRLCAWFVSAADGKARSQQEGQPSLIYCRYEYQGLGSITYLTGLINTDVYNPGDSA